MKNKHFIGDFKIDKSVYKIYSSKGNIQTDYRGIAKIDDKEVTNSLDISVRLLQKWLYTDKTEFSYFYIEKKKKVTVYLGINDLMELEEKENIKINFSDTLTLLRYEQIKRAK